jgi:hypothetical protein
VPEVAGALHLELTCRHPGGVATNSDETTVTAGG